MHHIFYGECSLFQVVSHRTTYNTLPQKSVIHRQKPCQKELKTLSNEKRKIYLLYNVVVYKNRIAGLTPGNCNNLFLCSNSTFVAGSGNNVKEWKKEKRKKKNSGNKFSATLKSSKTLVPWHTRIKFPRELTRSSVDYYENCVKLTVYSSFISIEFFISIYKCLFR